MADTDKAQPQGQSRPGHSDVPPERSIYCKPLDGLFRYGKPVDPVTILSYDLGNGQRRAFAALAKSRGNRLILWPPSDAREAWEFANGDVGAVHHVTLELSNGKTHFTRIDPNPNLRHDDRGWRLMDFGSGLKLWLICAFQVQELEKQVGVVGERIKSPRTDSNRRKEEFHRYAQQLRSVPVATPPLRGDCLVTSIYLLPDVDFRGPFERSHLPIRSIWNNWVEDWPDGDRFAVAFSAMTIGDLPLGLATVSPLGRLRSTCILGSV